MSHQTHPFAQCELCFDPHPNGKCLRSKCACVRKCWDDCCESIEHVVEEHEERLHGFSIWLPPPVRPSKQRLVDAVACTCWTAKVEDMDCTEDDLDLQLPLPERMAGFCSNLDAIFADFDDHEQERAVKVHVGSPVLAWEDNDEAALGLVPDALAPSCSAAIATPLPSPFQETLSEHSLSIFSARMQTQSIAEEAKTQLKSLIATLCPPTSNRQHGRSSVNFIQKCTLSSSPICHQSQHDTPSS
jgi:hypothetical protein